MNKSAKLSIKKGLSFLAIALAVATIHSCGRNSGNEKSDSKEIPIVKTTLSAVERRAKLDKDRADRIEQRMAAWAESATRIPTYTDEDGVLVYNKAEIKPSFKGGEDAMEKFLNDNIRYPKDAEDNKSEGTLFVDFTIGADGKVRRVVAYDAPGELADQSLRDEAVRVVASMPAWTPGRQRGKAVDVTYTLPVTFRMD